MGSLDLLPTLSTVGPSAIRKRRQSWHVRGAMSRDVMVTAMIVGVRVGRDREGWFLCVSYAMRDPWKRNLFAVQHGHAVAVVDQARQRNERLI